MRARPVVGREDPERGGQHRLAHLAGQGPDQLDDLRRQRLPLIAVRAREPGRDRGGEGVRGGEAEPGPLAAAATGLAGRWGGLRPHAAPAAAARPAAAGRPAPTRPAAAAPARPAASRPSADRATAPRAGPRPPAGTGRAAAPGSTRAGPARPRAAAEERGDGLRRIALAREGHPAAEHRLTGEQRLEEPIPERSIAAAGLVQVGGRDQRAVVDGRDVDVDDAGRAQLLDGQGPVPGGAGVAQHCEEGLQLAWLDVLLEAEHAAVAAVERPGERAHVRGLDLLAPAHQGVAGDPEDERARDGQGGAKPGVGGGQGRGPRRMAGRVGGQIPPCRHQRRHQLEQSGRGAGCLHVVGVLGDRIPRQQSSRRRPLFPQLERPGRVAYARIIRSGRESLGHESQRVPPDAAS